MHKNSDAENIEVAWSCGRPTLKWEGNRNKQTEFINKTMQVLSAGRKFRSPNCDVALIRKSSVSETVFSSVPLGQCFSTAGLRPGTGPRHQFYRAARDSPGICHFSFLSIFYE
jgi:hypothetical protein